jgi:hypothetical protein
VRCAFVRPTRALQAPAALAKRGLSGAGPVVQDETWQTRNRLAVASVEVHHEAALSHPTLHQVEDLHLSFDHNPTQDAETVFGTWIFVEKFFISDINANVTLTMSTNIAALLNYGADAQTVADGDLDSEPLQESHLLHMATTSGFQLINVSNVAMQLKVCVHPPPFASFAYPPIMCAVG